MTRGSLSAALAAFFVRSTFATCDCGAAPAAAPPPGFTELGVRVSTGTLFSSSATLEQPASHAPAATTHRAWIQRTDVLTRTDFIAVSFSSCPVQSPNKRASAAIGTPHRFVRRRRHQARFDLAIERDGHQDVTTLGARGVDDQAAVRREARTLVVAGVGEGLRVTAREVECVEAECAALARDVGERAPTGADRRAAVVAARTAHALGRAAGCAHAIDLWRAAAIADEIERAPVGREDRLGVDRAAVRDALHVIAAAPHQVELRAAFARQRERDRAPVG